MRQWDRKNLAAFFVFENWQKSGFQKYNHFLKEFFRRILEGGENIEENVIKVLIIKQYEHPEVYMLKNTLETMREAVEKQF